jgi:hypothetical protein
MTPIVYTHPSICQVGRNERRIRRLWPLVKRLFYDHRFLTCAAIASMLGFAIGLLFKVTLRGIITGFEPIIALVCAMIWLISIVVIDVVWPTKNRARDAGFFVGIARSAACLIVIGVVWLWSIVVLPDPAKIYLRIWHQYIESHWLTDPISRLSYFPLNYTSVSELETFPLNFYLLDANGEFKLDPYSDRLISPACPQAKYYAKYLQDNIYIVRFYIDDAAELAIPCLITPTPKKGNQP